MWRHGPRQQIETALDRRQQIVEVVRDAARELADHLQLLRLHQRRLGVLPFGDLHLEAIVGDQQLLRALGHARLQRIGVPAQIVLAARQRGGHVVVGRGELAKLRTRSPRPAPVCRDRHRASDAPPPTASRVGWPMKRRATNSVSRKATDRDPAQQQRHHADWRD